MTITVVNAGPRKVGRAVEVQATVAELFDIVANPYRHGELDGSGTVMDTVSGPQRLAPGDKFSVKMKQYGVPYRITSRVTEFDDGRILEWRHPMGHRWRWELEPQSESSTRVTETFDYSHVGTAKAKAFELFRVPRQNASGIEATLKKLEAKYPRPT
jgi:hypothetical protein